MCWTAPEYWLLEGSQVRFGMASLSQETPEALRRRSLPSALGSTWERCLGTAFAVPRLLTVASGESTGVPSVEERAGFDVRPRPRSLYRGESVLRTFC